jgi:hypothetical protein
MQEGKIYSSLGQRVRCYTIGCGLLRNFKHLGSMTYLKLKKRSITTKLQWNKGCGALRNTDDVGSGRENNLKVWEMRDLRVLCDDLLNVGNERQKNCKINLEIWLQKLDIWWLLEKDLWILPSIIFENL